MARAPARPGAGGDDNHQKRRRTLAVSALFVVSSALAALPGLGVTAAAASTTAASTTPPSYTNPLSVRADDGATAQSCPDPTVLQDRGAQSGTWFMFCTNASLSDAAGRRRSTALPVLTSRDLVTWRLVGPAVQRPAWAAPEARLWAPDIVYSRAHRRYYLTYTVTDTVDSVSGEPGCTKDSAIGVATSAHPLGPWRNAAAPLVPPRRAGSGCSFAATIDSDVLGDTVRRRGVLFFGGFHGGVDAQAVRLYPHRVALVGDRRRITTHRYEGANVVERDGYYYLLASAGHCCQGAVSGYGVFAGRATQPMGPYLDREGNRLLAQRTGGTPVLSSSGNRWVGPGHHSMFRDAAGRWWMAYHAIDLALPSFSGQPASTRRPVLLDPVDWRDGWPAVRAGRGASATAVPGPAAQRGQVSGYRPSWLPDDRTGALLASDDFADSTLDPSWTWVREPAEGGFALDRGGLALATSPHGFSGEERAPVLTRAAPEGEYVVETAVRLDVPWTSTSEHVQAGLVVYDSDERFLSLVHATPGWIRTTAFATNRPEDASGAANRGVMSVGPPGELTHLRIVHRHLGGHELYTAYTQQDGRRWVRGGTWRDDAMGQSPRLGLVAFGAAGYTATFEHLRAWALG